MRGVKPTKYTQHPLYKLLCKHNISVNELKLLLRTTAFCATEYIRRPERLRIEQILLISAKLGIPGGTLYNICAGIKPGTINHWYDEDQK